MGKIALITGITGQDGSYLAEFLLYKGYEVHGLIRRSSSFNTGRIEHLYKDPHEKGVRLFLHYEDMTALDSVYNLLDKINPDEIYNLGAQSHVQVSFDMPVFTSNVNAVGNLRIMEALKYRSNEVRYYQASSSEMFGSSPPPQNEDTRFRPMSPYAVAKLHAYWTTVNYRETYSIFASNGILFNHESPRRGRTFVTRKITSAIASIKAGLLDKVYLGNLEAKRDWGYAPEYVEVMWQIMQQESPDDFVIGTGESRSVQEFVEYAFGYAGLDWKKHVEQDARYFRPNEVNDLCADSSKSQNKLNWSPKIRFEEIVKIMVDADLESIGMTPIGDGHKIVSDNFGDWHC